MKIKNNSLFLRILHIFVPLIINKLKMKKIILLLSVVFLSTSALQAQDSKFYLGVGAGMLQLVEIFLMTITVESILIS